MQAPIAAAPRAMPCTGRLRCMQACPPRILPQALYPSMLSHTTSCCTLCVALTKDGGGGGLGCFGSGRGGFGEGAFLEVPAWCTARPRRFVYSLWTLKQ